MSDTDRRERLIQLVDSQLTQTDLGGTVGEKAAVPPAYSCGPQKR